ncbi:hypothetical protein Hanom_Chr06g00519071 [Helianthus anomalus]
MCLQSKQLEMIILILTVNALTVVNRDIRSMGESLNSSRTNHPTNRITHTQHRLDGMDQDILLT